MKEEPKPGTYGAIERSTEPWPWRYLLSKCTFSPEEFCQRGPIVVIEKGLILLDEVRKLQ
jgi:hypothetical protein